METFGKTIYAILVIIVAILLGGLTFSILWNWFMVSIFDLRSLTIPQAIGLITIVNYLNYKENKHESENETDSVIYKLTKTFLKYLSRCLITLFTAWVITLFM